MAEYPFFFTWGAQKNPQPVALAGGSGAHFELASGERWLDLGSLIYQANLGHGEPRMVAALKAQADRLCLSIPSADYPEKRELAERLLEKCPAGFDRVFFTLGGSDANENAIKIARLFTGKLGNLARLRSYHGATMGAVSLTGDWRRLAVAPGLPGVIHVADFDCAECPSGLRSPECDHEPITHIPEALERADGDVAAVFVESIVGANGVLIPPPGYMARVRAACDAHGALLVVDEVLAGFCRTGRFFGFEHFSAVPDLITCGKGLTAGYGTLGAVLVHERVSAHFDDHVLAAGLTHYAHPLGVAAALEAMRIYESDGLAIRAASLEAVVVRGLEEVAARVPGRTGRVRVRGLLGAVDLDLDPADRAAVKAELAKRRIHLHLPKSCGALIVAPPLCIAEDELRSGLLAVAEAVGEALEQ